MSLIKRTSFGHVVFPVTGFLMTDESGFEWHITIDNTGTIIITAVSTSSTILLETGDHLLLETGDKVLTEA